MVRSASKKTSEESAELMHSLVSSGCKKDVLIETLRTTLGNARSELERSRARAARASPRTSSRACATRSARRSGAATRSGARALGGELKKSLDGHAETERRLRVEVDARRNDAAVLRAEAVEALRGRGEVDERLAGVALVAEQRQAARHSHLPPDFNGRVIEGQKELLGTKEKLRADAERSRAQLQGENLELRRALGDSQNRLLAGERHERSVQPLELELGTAREQLRDSRSTTGRRAAAATSTSASAACSCATTRRWALRLTSGASRHEATLRFDGSAKPNPGRGGAGYVLSDHDGRVVETGCVRIGSARCTNNMAEYVGLIQGLKSARRQGIRGTLRVQGDSQLVVNQLKGIFEVRSAKLESPRRRPTTGARCRSARNADRVRSQVSSTTVPSKFWSDVVAAGSLGLAGDLICQAAEGRRDVDVRRAASLALFSGAYSGGLLHVLYGYLPRWTAAVGRAAGVAALSRPSSRLHGAGCSLLDNAHCGLVYIPAYFFAVGALQGHFANFSYVAAAHRVKFVAVGNLAWSVAIDIAHAHAPVAARGS
ncbi:hypothetical protein JL720_3878 [Aureococcus anophagefferens]|nr:hypothetical protein JL720_3878 [Aureococcus anophagefferens]